MSLDAADTSVCATSHQPTNIVSTNTSDAAVKTTSKATIIFSQALLSGPMGLPATKLTVNCIAAINTGTRAGYVNIGSMTSRRRMLTVSALQKVPISVSPQVPSAT